MPSNNQVLHLWRVDIRPLRAVTAERRPFCWHVASTSSLDEKKVVDEAMKRFTPIWWAGHIITGLEYIGDLHVIEGSPLHE